MLIPLYPQVTGFKVENLWRQGSRGRVRCTVRLSRRLRAEESERVERIAQTVDRSEVVHECRPEEIEEWHTRLVEALAGYGIGAPPRRAGGGERKPRRVARKRATGRPRSTDPAT